MIRLAVRCRPEQAELVLAELVELVPGGVEEERGGDYVEYAIYGPPGELPDLPDLGRPPARAWSRSRRPRSPTTGPTAGATSTSRSSSPAGGSSCGPRGRTPAREARWTSSSIPAGPSAPARHATTRSCLELLLALADRGLAAGPLADWGTGSGVLAIAAAKLGWEPVTGCDHEQAAVEAAAANAAANAAVVAVERLNLRERPPPQAPTVVANLTAPLLVPLATRMAAGEIAVPDRMRRQRPAPERAGPGRRELRGRRACGRGRGRERRLGGALDVRADARFAPGRRYR